MSEWKGIHGIHVQIVDLGDARKKTTNELFVS